MNRFARLALLASMMFAMGHAALAMTADEQELQQQLSQSKAIAKPQPWKMLNAKTWSKAANALATHGPATAAACQEVNKQVIMGAYVVTSDAQGQPCRIYDLSFPTLQTLFAHQAVSQLPVQKFHARDYMNWLKGDYQSVLNNIQTFNGNLGQQPVDLAGWVSKVQFKTTFANVNRVPGTHLPASFHASDLDLGTTPLQFSAKDQQALEAVFHAVYPDATQDEISAWELMVMHPVSLLEHIRFDWNDAKKVYDIFIEGQFLPIRGPIALVDYNASYKLSVEGVLRSITHTALSQIVNFIPAPARGLVSVAIDDTFQFMDMAYAYQINKFQGTFNVSQKAMDAKSWDRGMNILAAGSADFVTLYLTSIITQKPFDWTQLEDQGRTIRYDQTNNRDIMVTDMNSAMVLNKGCQMQIVNDYFGICTKSGKQEMYSMISDNQVLFWDFGAPLVYNYKMPAETLMLRGTAYLLSVGTRLFDLPYIGFLQGQLTSACQTFAFGGVTDEGFLRAAYNVQKAQGAQLDSSSADISKWLYLQNLNIFLPKTEAQENAVIKANGALLGLTL